MSRGLLRHALVSLGLAAMLAACAGMPSKPKPVVLPTEAPLAGLDAPGGGAWPSQQWWQRYQDPMLDQLIDMGLAAVGLA